MAKRKKRMWWKLKLIAILFFVVGACTNRPKEILTPGEMEDVFFELYLVDGAIEQKISMGGAVDTSLMYMYQHVLHDYELSQADFDSSLVWYANRPKQFKRIYENVIQRLEEHQNQETARVDLVDSLAKMNEIKSYSVWNKASKFDVGHDSVLTHLQFSIVDSNFVLQDEYVFRYKAIAHFKDSSEHFKTGLYLYYADGKVDSLIHSIRADSVERSYTFYFHARRDHRIDSLGGNLLMVADTLPSNFKLQFRDVDLVRQYKMLHAKVSK